MEDRYKIEKISDTMVNGYVDYKNSAKNPLGRIQITYFNPTSSKNQTQNFLEMEDVVVPVILRRNEENGELEFAMQYEYIPAIDKVMLELPDCPFFYDKKSKYSYEDVRRNVKERLENLGLEVGGMEFLDSGETPVSQSFTDQIAKFIEVYTREEVPSDKLEWFPISCIPDYLKSIGSNSSLQTQYALQLFADYHKEEIDRTEKKEFKPDMAILGKSKEDWQDERNIMEHKIRFGIELAENKSEIDENIENYGQVAEYGLSKNSAQCLIVRKIADGKIKIGLSKQQRSPFIAREGIDEYFQEAAAGMLENEETFEEAAVREAREETGLIDIKLENLIHLSAPSLLSKGTQEYSDYYMCIVETIDMEKQDLDEQENIDDVEWFDLYELDLNNINSPLPTKYLIIKAREYFLNEKNRIIDFLELDERL